MSKLFKNKIVFITGVSSGFGEACAWQFAEKGADLILCARRFDLIEKLAEDIREKYNVKILPMKLDVRNRVEVDQCIDELPSEWKKVDILVNNAGLASGLSKLHEGDIEDWERMIDTNIKGLLYVTRQIVPLMVKYGIKGQVINIGSIAGIYAYPKGAVYCGSKAAVRVISDGLRMDLVDTGIRVCNIQPGLAETEFSLVRFHGDKERAKVVYEGIDALQAEDVAEAVIFAASRPAHVQICEITITPTHQAAATVVHRK